MRGLLHLQKALERATMLFSLISHTLQANMATPEYILTFILPRSARYRAQCFRFLANRWFTLSLIQRSLVTPFQVVLHASAFSADDQTVSDQTLQADFADVAEKLGMQWQLR